MRQEFTLFYKFALYVCVYSLLTLYTNYMIV